MAHHLGTIQAMGLNHRSAFGGPNIKPFRINLLSGSTPRPCAAKCIAMLKKNGYSPYPRPVRRYAIRYAIQKKCPSSRTMAHLSRQTPTRITEKGGNPRCRPLPSAHLQTIAVADEVERIEL